MSAVNKDLPSISCISSMNLEARQVSKQRIADMLSEEKNLTLLRDRTTKRAIHLYSVKLARETETFTIGLRQISNTTAIKMLATTKDVIDSVEKAQPGRKRILPIVTNTMTDRCATELKVNKLLYELKKTFQKVVNNFEEIGDECVNTFDDVNEFKCAVHPLLPYSTEAEQVIKI